MAAMATGRPPGRPRSEESRAAILSATVDLVADQGFAALTVEGIAARAGVGKQTIYRWWPTKADVLLDAIATKADLFVPLDDHGSYPADLRAFLTDSFALGRRPVVVAMLQALMAQAQTDPEFKVRFRSGFLEQRRAALRSIVARAGDRGDLPAGPRRETVLDMVFGVIWYRVLTSSDPVDDALVDELVAVLTTRTVP
jgi:AcrR family transcriptional regulator